MEEPAVALVVAAGSGSRLGAALPKAFVPVAGVSLLRRSCRAMVASGCTALVVVAPDTMLDDARREASELGVPVEVVAGGARRQDSVAHGLAAVPHVAPSAQVVLVHDAARAFVPPRVAATVIAAVRSGAVAVVPAVPVVDTIRHLGDEASRSSVVDRSRLVAVQTPQGFRLDALVAAHAALDAAGTEVTDDAAACEAVGHAVTIVPGARESMKVTEPLDLLIAEALAGNEQMAADALPRVKEQA